MRNIPGAVVVTEDGQRQLMKGGPASYSTGVTPKLTAEATAERKPAAPRKPGGMGM